MTEYAGKSYGRNEEVDTLYRLFEAGHDVSMPGPRRLGKTFVLDRLVDAAPARGWTAVKVELAGCADCRAVFRELCSRIASARSIDRKTTDWLRQRLGQFLEPRFDSGGPWYQPFLTLDHETYFERLVKAMDEDRMHRWVLLIDEVPIFLKALHDRGPDGVSAARDFMNLTSRLRQQYPRVRWMITGSIGIEPLAQAGNYMGVLSKFQIFELKPLTPVQARGYVRDLATDGHLLHRNAITDPEAEALIEQVGWCAAYYLEALAQKMRGDPATDPEEVARIVEAAMNDLLQPTELAKFATWEEHLRKHYGNTERAVAFSALGALAREADGLDLDGLLAAVRRPDLTRADLRQIMTRLHVEGFVTVGDWDSESPRCTFLNPLLRRWWQRHGQRAGA